MYEEYYGLSGSPFRLTPDRRFFFGSEGHRKALQYLRYGLLQGEGFIVISGDVGTGKSTLVAQLFEELDRNSIVAAQIGTTQVDADDAVRLICAAFDVRSESTEKAAMLAAFEEFLVEQNQRNRRVLLVVDEAQNLPMRTLEELRMLSNFNIQGQSLFQCFLLGQLQFQRTLEHPDLAQLKQRVIASYQLQPMSEEETKEYILHRLQTVNWDGDPDFTEAACEVIFRETQGVPRRINTLCNRVMLFGALEELHEIDADVIEQVIRDLQNEVVQGGLKDPQTGAGKALTQLQAAAANAPRPSASGQTAPLPPTLERSTVPASETIARRELGEAERSSAPLPPARDPSQISADYSPYLAQAEADNRYADLVERVERIEATLVEHEKALRELIDVAVNYLTASAEPPPPRTARR